MKLHELKRQKAALVTKMKAIVTKEDEMKEGEALSDEDKTAFEDLKDQVEALEARIGRVEDVMAAQAEAAEPVAAGDDAEAEEKKAPVGVRRALGAGTAIGSTMTAPATAKAEVMKGLVVAGAAKMMVLGGGNLYGARSAAKDVYGEQHPVTKALVSGSGPSGGFLVPPEYVAEVIELLRPQTVVRASGPIGLSMPRGTMTLPRQNQAATAGYGGETTPIAASQPGLGVIVATYKKLTALVPVSNDLLRYSDPSADQLVRDDIVQVLARREDLAFIRGDGTEGSPKGFLTFCPAFNVVASNPAWTLNTAAQEIGQAINLIETGNVPIVRPVWLMNPRSKNFFLNVQNSVGAYVYRDEMLKGTLLGVPFRTTTQIPTNLVVGPNADCSEVYLVEMSQAMILDSMTLELGVSREASYVDASGTLVHTFQQDQSLVRAIAEHDFQMRHDEAIVVIKGVRWKPSIS